MGKLSRRYCHKNGRLAWLHGFRRLKEGCQPFPARTPQAIVSGVGL
jgi:hypothetical protein